MTLWCSVASWWVRGGGREAAALLAGMVALLFYNTNEAVCLLNFLLFHVFFISLKEAKRKFLALRRSLDDS